MTGPHTALRLLAGALATGLMVLVIAWLAQQPEPHYPHTVVVIREEAP